MTMDYEAAVSIPDFSRSSLLQMGLIEALLVSPAGRFKANSIPPGIYKIPDTSFDIRHFYFFFERTESSILLAFIITLSSSERASRQ